MEIISIIVGIVIGYFLNGFFPNYINEKGKNLATKEDIGKITEIVETIKKDNAELLELQKAKHQLRMAAIDKRLETHQQAFSFLRKLNSPHLSKEQSENMYWEIFEWWTNHCLYLEPEASKAFTLAIDAIRHHPDALASAKIDHDKERGIRLVIENAERITNGFRVIQESIQLPAISDIQLNLLTSGEKS
ncbi:MAG: hypothetical protein RL020_1534 [Pseudomonadota bacterium]|jgi:hypothetical protein